MIAEAPWLVSTSAFASCSLLPPHYSSVNLCRCTSDQAFLSSHLLGHISETKAFNDPQTLCHLTPIPALVLLLLFPPLLTMFSLLLLRHTRIIWRICFPTCIFSLECSSYRSAVPTHSFAFFRFFSRGCHLVREVFSDYLYSPPLTPTLPVPLAAGWQ